MRGQLLHRNQRNVAHLLASPGFELMRHDVTFPLYVEVDRIFNLACPASPDPLPVRSRADDEDQRPRRHQHAGPRQAREGADPAGVDQSEVYGDPAGAPADGDYWGNVNPIGPRSCYDEGKRCAETLFFDYRRQHELDIKVVRIFNTYGPRMHPNDGRVVSNFIVQALQRRRHHALRRRQADAIVLLRRRSGRRPHPADGSGRRRDRSNQSRQSERSHDAAACGARPRADTQLLKNRISAAPAR